MNVFLATILCWPAAFAVSLFEPSIECTVIKVIEPQSVFGISRFPELHQSINNNPQTSKLIVGKKELLKVDPVSVVKTDRYEKILIKEGNSELILELKGKPISRNGTMAINGKLAAEVTCH
jgi:hypothetical protein